MTEPTDFKPIDWTLKHLKGGKLNVDLVAICNALGLTDAEVGRLVRGKIVKGMAMNQRLLNGRPNDSRSIKRAKYLMTVQNKAAKAELRK